MNNTFDAGCAFDVVSGDCAFNENMINAPFLPGVQPAVVRYAGGCAEISPEVVAGMPAYFEAAHEGVGRIVAFSGGTFNTEDVFDAAAQRTVRQAKGFMITQVPALLKAKYGCFAMSTTPRTGQMFLDRDFGGLQVNDHGDRIDYRQDRAVIVQKDAADIAEVDWSKDVLPYLNLMVSWQKQGVNVAVVAFNGGGVTEKEFKWALERGIPVIFIRGSLRKTDAFITAFEKGEARVKDLATGDEVAPNPALVSIADINDPQTLRNALIARGIIKAAA